VALRPLDEEMVGRVLAEFPGLKLERRDGYLIAPWLGKDNGDRGEEFAAGMMKPDAWWSPGGMADSLSLGAAIRAVG
jgi:hypothetical protein